MEQSELLRYVAGVLEQMKLRYFVTGSTATIFYGEARFTNDIDVVVDLPESQVQEFCRHFPDADFYVSEDAALDATRHKTQFNVIHPASGLKVDLIVPALDLYCRSQFARIRRLNAGENFLACFTSPEDVIIKKMEAYREGGSEKHLRDIAGVLTISGATIDRTYISRWANDLDLNDIWKAVQNRLPPTPPAQSP